MAGDTADTLAAPRARSATREAPNGKNIDDVERVASVAAGGALAAYALKERGLTGLLAGVVGGLLVERGVTGHCRVYDAMGVNAAEPHGLVQQHGAKAVLDASSARKVDRAVTIFGKSPDELFAFWRDFGNLPRIMQHLESVTVRDATRSHWVAKAPAGRTVEWDAEIHNEVPGQLIAWRSMPGADVKNAGSVHFKNLPAGRGTEVRVVLEYAPPAGALGALVAKLFGEDPELQVREDLRRFKQLMEAGELAVSEIPGQGRPAKAGEFNARANADPLVSAVAADRETPHEPTHVPPPSDVGRGTTTSEQGRN